MELTVVHVEVDNPVAPPFVSFDQNDYTVTINYRKTQNSRSTYAVVAKAIPISTCYIHEDYEEYVHNTGPKYYEGNVHEDYEEYVHNTGPKDYEGNVHEDYEEYVHNTGPKDPNNEDSEG
ncbi:hypothetical protein ABMA27_016184 [Loxostege sticticalis]|uniref:Uncharacterized protein n=1 Tax=Loxostege sticticalis TaxID=481309 RepID=A0ABR3I5X5_LOXSC